MSSSWDTDESAEPRAEWGRGVLLGQLGSRHCPPPALQGCPGAAP